jgi:hypothetical protein
MTRRETIALQSDPAREAQRAVIRDLASITARSDLHDRRAARRPLVIGEPGFIAGTAIAFIVLCPLALAAMENLNPVTFFLVRPYVPVGLQGVLATFGAWLCLSALVGIGAVCIVERRLRWSVVLPSLLLALCILFYIPASNAAATQACAHDRRTSIQVRC